MNLAATMAVLRLEGVGGAEKLALLIIALRAEKGSITLTRSLPALAVDMGVSENTAARAVGRVTERGYLQVAHRLGTSNTYTLKPPLNLVGVTPDNLVGVPPPKSQNTPTKMGRVKRKTRERLEGADRTRADTAALGAVDNGNGGRSSWTPNPRPHPAGCTCGGTGWIDDPDTNEATPCNP